MFGQRGALQNDGGDHAAGWSVSVEDVCEVAAPSGAVPAVGLSVDSLHAERCGTTPERSFESSLRDSSGTRVVSVKTETPDLRWF